MINASRRRTVNGVPPYKETVGYVSQGVKVYRWLKEQGRFGASDFILHREMIARERPRFQVQRRFRKAKQFRFFTIREPVDEALISRETSDEPQLLDFGPVIVGPTIPTNSTQLARSTFAGETVYRLKSSRRIFTSFADDFHTVGKFFYRCGVRSADY